MKKILLILALGLTFTACSEENEASFKTGSYLVISGDLIKSGTIVVLTENTIQITDQQYPYSKADFYMVTDAFEGCDKVRASQWKDRMLITDCKDVSCVLEKI